MQRMVRPEGRALVRVPRGTSVKPSCVGLAGVSPAAVSAGAPRSRSRSVGERSPRLSGMSKALREPYGYREGGKTAGPA